MFYTLLRKTNWAVLLSPSNLIFFGGLILSFCGIVALYYLMNSPKLRSWYTVIACIAMVAGAIIAGTILNM